MEDGNEEGDEVYLRALRSGVVTLTDGEREYEMLEHEAWRIGDRAECVVLTRGTEDKSDDEIVEARYVWRK